MKLLQTNRLVKSVASRLGFILPEEQDSRLFSLLVRGATGSIAIKIAFTGLGLLTSLMLARTLEVVQYGTYAYVMSLITLLGIAPGLGLSNVMVRFIATYNRQGEWGKIKGLIRYSNIAVIIVSFFIILAVYLLMQFIISDKSSSTLYSPLLIALLLIPMNSIMNSQGATLRGFHWIVLGQVPSLLVRSLLYLILIVVAWLLLRNSLDVQLIISLNIAATAVAIFLGSYLLLKVMPSAVKKSRPEYESNSWIRSSFPLILLSGMFMINAQTDILMLGSIKGIEMSGIYQIANRGAALIYLVAFSVYSSFAPVIAHLYAGKEIDKLQRLVTRSSRLVMLFSLPIAFSLIIFGDRLLSIFGEGFTRGLAPLLILSISQLVNVVAGPATNILVMTGHERDAAWAIAISTLANVVLNAAFIPLWGMEGAALATGGSIILSNVICIWFVRKRIKIHTTVFG